MFQRSQVQVLIERLQEPANRLIVVTGPRQTGKTTLVKQALRSVRAPKEYMYTAVDEPLTHSLHQSDPEAIEISNHPTNEKDVEWLTRCWEEARKAADKSERGFILVIDEIQKIPQWSDAVKGLWDADRALMRPLHVIILGSAPLLMQQGLTESLAGRYELIRVPHWSFLEMHEAFDFDLPSYIYFGGYPGAATLIHEQNRWADYVRSSLIEPNIEKDILMVTRVDKPALLKQLFELGCHHSGQLLSLTKMKGSLTNAGNETTLAHYLNLLTNAGLLTGLQKYASQQPRRRASVPKLNVLNTGFMSAISGYTFEQALADRTYWGRLVESTVGAHLYNMGTPSIKLYYWRDGHNEVDFILEQGNQTVAIEVKSSPHDKARGGLDTFNKSFNPYQTILVGDEGIPLNSFLTTNPSLWFE